LQNPQGVGRAPATSKIHGGSQNIDEEELEGREAKGKSEARIRKRNDR